MQLEALQLVASKAPVVDVFGTFLFVAGGLLVALTIGWIVFQGFRFGAMRGVLTLIGAAVAIGVWCWTLFPDDWPLELIPTTIGSVILSAMAYGAIVVEHRYKSIVTSGFIFGVVIFAMGFIFRTAASDCEENDECLDHKAEEAEEEASAIDHEAHTFAQLFLE